MKPILFVTKYSKYLFFLTFVLAFLWVYWWTTPKFTEIGTIKIWDHNQVLLFEAAGVFGKRIPVSYEKFPKSLIDAVLAAEDVTFWKNPGVDLAAIFRAVVLNFKARQIVSGGSTITQQLARTTITIPQKQSQRSFIRKIREILVAYRLSATYSKTDLLTRYLNLMYFGNLAYGVQSAAATYFNKDASQLSLAESALLASLISHPETRNPFVNLSAALDGQKQVLNLMVKHGFITESTAKEAETETINLNQSQIEIKAPHFVQYVLDELKNLNIKTDTGLNVFTTLDYPTYNLSQDIAGLWVKRLNRDHDLNNAALVLIKNSTGEIRNMLGGIDYFSATSSGAVNMAVALRQPGSALKPVTYATAFMQGVTPATLIYDVKKIYQTKTGEGFAPNNYDARFHGPVLVRVALASSLNLPAVEMLNQVGIDNFLKIVRSLGITSLTESDRYDLALTLGGGEVKLLDLTNAYASFARGGEYKPVYAIEKITLDNGKEVYRHQDSQSLAVLGKNSRQIAYLITHILADPKARIPGFGEKNPLVLSRVAAVKTGTTTDWHDNWTIGFTPSFTVGVWVGNNDNHPMRNITGVVGAAPIWNQFFEEYLKGKTKEEFSRPDKINMAEICQLTGKLPDGLCPEKTTELFISGTEPQEVSNWHKRVKIDSRNNLLAGVDCPLQYVEEKIFVDYPAELYSWAVNEGLPVIPSSNSPLCNSIQDTKGTSYIMITSPTSQTVFEHAPELVTNEAVVFEAAVSADISSVAWYVDGQLIIKSGKFPFSASWNPKLGKHQVRSVGELKNGNKIESTAVNFSVVEYKRDL